MPPNSLGAQLVLRRTASEPAPGPTWSNHAKWLWVYNGDPTKKQVCCRLSRKSSIAGAFTILTHSKWREETNYIEMVIHTILLCWLGTDSQMMQASYDFITVYQASRVASDLLIFLLRQKNVRSSDSNKFASHQNKPWRKAVTRLCRKPRPRGQKLIVHGAVWATRQLWYGLGTWNCWQNWKPQHPLVYHNVIRWNGVFWWGIPPFHSGTDRFENLAAGFWQLLI